MAERTRGTHESEKGTSSRPRADWYGERRPHYSERNAVRSDSLGHWRVKMADAENADASGITCEVKRKPHRGTDDNNTMSKARTSAASNTDYVESRHRHIPSGSLRSTPVYLSGNRATFNRQFVRESGVGSNRPAHTDNPVEMLRKLASAEPSEALLALGSSRSGVSKFFTYQKIGDTRIVELLIKVLQNACLSSHSPKVLSHLLKSVNESGFLNVHLLNYLASHQYDIDDSLVIGICNILKTFLHHLPSSSLPTVTILVSQLNLWRVNKNRLAAEMHQEAIESVLNADELAKSTAKQIRGGDLVRDQELDKTELEDEPPDDFRKIPTYPSVSEIKSVETPFLRKNIIFGAYRDVDHYIDVQYRLLREDFVCPLREGLRSLQQYKESNMPLDRLSDIRYYANVRVLIPYCTNKGVLYRVRFDVSPFKRIKWESSKRLIFGSLVGLSKDDFETISFGTVAAREPALLRKGEVDLSFEDENAYLLDLNPYTEYQMIECSAYFEACRHNLEGLQEIQSGSLPFEQYILNKSQAASEVMAPRYLRGQYVTYDFRSLSSDNRKWRNVPVLDKKAWPNSQSLGLDESQYEALQTAVMKEFVTIQGPPGTGKTFIGLKIVQLLLDNKEHWMGGNSPILIVCYTNHALDQFLEGIVDLCHLESGKLVRVGGRCASEKLQSCTLYEVKKKRDFHTSAFGQFAIADVKEGMTELAHQIANLVGQVECARTRFVDERFLQQYMTGAQAKSFFSHPSFHSGYVLIEWLNVDLDDLSGSEVGDEQSADDLTDAIIEDDEEEVRKIQEDRQIGGTTHVLPQNLKHLQQINDASQNSYLQMDTTKLSQWQKVRGRKNHWNGKALLKRVQRLRPMSQEESMHVVNVWSLPMVERWRLYNFWVSCLCEELSLQIRHSNAEYNRLTNRLDELYAEGDFQALRQAQVIGMTTTGAAKCRQLLQRVRPRIVIVEEAAEVLEAHIVTTLSSHCQHLIMIGDHQQLRPNTTVYKLAKKYHMDISLFERMVKNDLHCDRLKIQHRMRPEIVQLIVPHIYKELENHESVRLYENVAGINGNVFFINHTEDERSITDTRSHSNDHEARFLAALCRYLLQQGYKPSQITVLTTYTGQMFLLRQMMPKSDFDGVRITPVDNYQGEENDIILLSLVRSNVAGKIGFLQIQNRVCVALSRAKKGLYVIGNMTMIADASSLWSGIVKDLEEHGRLVDALPLACQNHPKSVLSVKTHIDFAKAPEGGCMLDCGIRLKCGHVCVRKCHPVDRDHEEYKCEKPCTKTCKSGHPCQRKCHQACGECDVLVPKIIPKCSHKQMVRCHFPPELFVCKVPCEKMLPGCGHRCPNTCGQTCRTECLVIVADREWPCGHLLTVECYLNPRNMVCDIPVIKTLRCGHTAELKCSEDIEDHQCMEIVTYKLCEDVTHTHKTSCNKLSKDRLNKCQMNVLINCSLNSKHTFMAKCCESSDARCPIVCNVELPCGHLCSGKCSSCSETKTHQLCRAACRKRLPCQHQCTATCGESCPPCRASCTLHCGHRPCSQSCGNACDICDLPCRWNCTHHHCELKCAEPCTRPPCDKSCSNSLPCGHRCIGLCGEPCPPWCSKCNEKNIRQLVLFLEVPKVSDRTRFLHLKPCGHVVEVKHMDAWVRTQTRKPPCEPVPVTCPICKQRVGLCPRYNNQIKQYMIDLNTIKKSAMTTNRFNGNIDRVVKTFWPDNSTTMKEVLLTPDSEVDSILSFTSVALGAICVWQECWDLLQSCVRRDSGKSPQYATHSTTLEGIKTELIAAVGRTDLKLTAKNIILMEMIYLNLHVCRLMVFIKNPRLLLLLGRLCTRTSRQAYHSLSMLETCSEVNDELRVNFNLRQKDNIADYLKHLQAFFQPDVTNHVQVQKWLICERGHAFGVGVESTTASCDRCRPAIVVETAGAEADPQSVPIHDLIVSVLVKASREIVKEREQTNHDSILARFEMLSLRSVDREKERIKAKANRYSLL